MESFLVHAGYGALILFAFLEAACIPIPSEITFGFAGVLAYQGHLNLALVIILGTLAEMAGSFLSYGVGRLGGRPLAEKYGKYVLITRSDLDRAERFTEGRGSWAIPVGRALPIVRAFMSLVSGIIEVPPVRFGLLSLLGTAIYSTAIACVGYGVASAWTSVSKGLSLASYAIVAVVIVMFAVFIAHRVREVRKENRAGQQVRDPVG
jgi:membrane protein DedA with SNARE-associated domain